MKNLLIIVSLLFAPALAAAPSITLCSYDCSEPLPHTLSEASWQHIKSLFQGPASSAQQQRQQLAAALALMERDIISRLASDNSAASESDEDPQQALAEQLARLFSNQDETRNSSRFIALLLDRGLLRRHVLRHSAVRHNLLGVSQSSAVIQSLDDGELFAVDASSSGFGEPPLIDPLQHWKHGSPVKKLFSRLKDFVSSDENHADDGATSGQESASDWE